MCNSIVLGIVHSDRMSTLMNFSMEMEHINERGFPKRQSKLDNTRNHFIIGIIVPK